nr:50S ribosomal protein L34e [Nanoarchaeum sp.]
MPEGKHKSRTLRRVFVKTPGKKNLVHYRQRKMNKKTCAECGKQLHGIPHVTHVEFKNLAKTKKKPQRPYGGVLCSSCMRKKIIEQVL